MISNKMMYTPLAEPTVICCNCWAYKNYEKNEITLGELRWQCQYCKSFGTGGIYKGDIVISAMRHKNKKNNLTAGRKPTHYKRYGNAVKKLLEKGESLRSIADILGISVNTVQKIKVQLNRGDIDDIKGN